MKFDFTQPQYNVTQREELPHSIKKSLISIERSNWFFHPKYHGKAEFFIQYHEGLMNTSIQILSTLKALLDNPGEDSRIYYELNKVKVLCYALFANAHRHHMIEDHSYFPMFRKIELKMGAGIDLLENDHKRLSLALDVLKSSLQQGLHTAGYSAIGKLYQSAVEVDNILVRHLSDEEEIIIPIFLKH